MGAHWKLLEQWSDSVGSNWNSEVMVEAIWNWVTYVYLQCSLLDNSKTCCTVYWTTG